MSARTSGWQRMAGRTRERAELVVLSLVIVGSAGFALQVAPASADDEQLVGADVPAADVPIIVSAALSCPALNPPRLAAQLMEISGFDEKSTAEQATDGTAGIAGLDDKTWAKWRPWSFAQRGDTSANILALAHQTCAYVGRLRGAKMSGDLWPAAVAATEAGLQPVLDANGVPAGAKTYVDRVSAYADFYARRPEFRVGTTPSAVPTAALVAVTVPDEYLADVRAAGDLCKTITPARIAAQLTAASNFDPNKRSDTGAQGIAQFTPQLWQQYKKGSAASVWKPDDAIPALGRAMCDLVEQFGNLTGGDPYTLALGAFQWGPDAIRRANGLPRANVPQLSTVVQAYASTFDKDPALTQPTEDTSPAPASPASPSAEPTTIPGSRIEDGGVYQLVNTWSRSVVELPGNEESAAAGTRVTLWQNLHQKDQYWRVDAAPVKGYVVFTNAFSGKSLGIENAGKDNFAKLAQLDSDPADENQQWQLRDAGQGEFWLLNHASGKAMDLLGDDRPAPMSGSTWNGYLVEQYDLQTYAKDQRWEISRISDHLSRSATQ